MALDRDASEAALSVKDIGTFLLRPKDAGALVASLRVQSGVEHIVIHRVGMTYQSDGVGGGSTYEALHDFMDALRLTCKLSRLTFLDDAADLARPGAVSPQIPPEAPAAGWRRTVSDNLFGVGGGDGALFGSSSGGDEEAALFTELAEQDDLTSAMQLGDVQSENRRLRQRVEELAAQLRKRDAELAAAGAKIAKLAALLPKDGVDGTGRPLVGGRGDASVKAKDLLLSKLGEFGFSDGSLVGVLDDIQESRAAGADGEVTVNEVLDRLLTSEAVQQGSMGLQGLEQSSFLGRQGGARRGPALPSASQFGLFGDGPPQSDAAMPEATPASAGGGAPDGDSALFDGVGAVSEQKPKDGTRVGGKPPLNEGKAIAYNDFLTRLMRPESADLVQHVKLFIGSVLGPNNDGSPPLKHQVAGLEYQFYGDHMLRRRCADFFDAIEKAMSKHPAWREEGEATLTSARNNLEKYVMTKLADLAIAGERDEEQDRALSRRMAVLDFVTPEALEVNPSLRNEVVWNIAQDELRKMATFKAPGDKIACVVKCAQVIFSVLNLQRGSDDTSRPGADDFLPIFIFVVLKSKVPNLYTNCEYIQNYHNPAALMSKAGYCFVNLRSAVEFILTLDGSVLNVDAADFDAKLAEAEARFDAKRGSGP